jgi:hypothetical protein
LPHEGKGRHPIPEITILMEGQNALVNIAGRVTLSISGRKRRT